MGTSKRDEGSDMKRIVRRLGLATVALAGMLWVAPLSTALAQGETSTAAAAAPAKKPPPGFQKVEGAPSTEQVDANKLVVIAYIAFFAGMFGFVIYVTRQQSSIAKEMEALARRIGTKDD